MTRHAEHDASHGTNELHERAGIRTGGYRAELLSPPTEGPASTMPLRGLLGIAWSEWLTLLTLVGVLLYGTVAFAYWSFYAELDVTPDEVGLGYAEIIQRTGPKLSLLLALAAIGSVFTSFGRKSGREPRTAAFALGAALMLLLSLATVFLLAAVLRISASEGEVYAQLVLVAGMLLGIRALWGWMRPHDLSDVLRNALGVMRSASQDEETRRRKRRASTGILVMLAVGVPIFAFAFVQWLPQTGWGTMLFGMLAALLLFGAPLVVKEERERRLRRAVFPLPAPVVLAFLGIAALILFVSASAIGSAAATRVKTLEDPIDQGSSRLFFLDVNAPSVCVLWLASKDAPSPSSFTHEVVYLGRASGITVLYDTVMQSALRIPSSNLATYTLSDVDRNISSRRPRSCRSPTTSGRP